MLRGKRSGVKSHDSDCDPMDYRHVSAMPTEVVHFLDCRPGRIYVDGTLGGSGHARLILERILPGGTLIGIDQDRDALTNGEKTLEPYLSNTRLFHDSFTHLREILEQLGILTVDGILLDLGVSLYQFESSGRGFSFRRDEPLDMRMNAGTGISAETIVNQMPEKELKRIFSKYGEERWAGRVARTIVKERAIDRITSSLKLADIICSAVPGGSRTYQRIHPATRVFMALRIVVNEELERLSSFMETAGDFLNPGGRLCILSFHSLEDRIVKRGIRILEKGCICPSDFPKCVCGKKSVMRSLTKKALRPSESEIAANPMARSTRLRAAERLV